MLLKQDVELTPMVYNLTSEAVEECPEFLYGDDGYVHHQTLDEEVPIIPDTGMGLNLLIYSVKANMLYLAQSIDFDFE